MSCAARRSPPFAATPNDRLARLAKAYAVSLEIVAGAIARHDGSNLTGAQVLASRTERNLIYARQAADVIDGLRLPGLELATAARRAVMDHVLFDGPHDRPDALETHPPSRLLVDLIIQCGGALAEAVA